jgi:hypothetical protein
MLGSPVGGTMTALPGVWDAGVTLSYQWLRGSSPIAGATKSTYVPVAADLVKEISVTVTGTKPGYATVSVHCNTGWAPGRGTLDKTSTPKISGTAKVGKKLTAVAGTWTAGVTLSYQWYRGSAKISKATNATYKLVTKDKGKLISVRVTGSKSAYTTVAKSSRKTGKIK